MLSQQRRAEDSRAATGDDLRVNERATGHGHAPPSQYQSDLDDKSPDRETRRVLAAHANSMSRSARTQRRGAILLCIALCFWLFAFASHVHANDDQGAHGKTGTVCTFCLSLPSGAPAPALPQIAAAPAATAVVSVLLSRRFDAEVPSSYLIRGPPAF